MLTSRIRAQVPGSARALACNVRRLAERQPLGHRGAGLRRGRRKLHARRVGSPILFAAILVATSTLLFAAEVIPPKPDRYFNDYANVVSPEAGLRFNDQLAQFERDTSNQVVVAVFSKMQTDSDIADYTQRVAQSWGVGQQDKRNGVVFFVFTQDRKMFIQVGYGLEGALPDATAFDITEYRVKPYFRSNNYEAGITMGIHSILEAIRGEYKGTGLTVRQRQNAAASGRPSIPFL